MNSGHNSTRLSGKFCKQTAPARGRRTGIYAGFVPELIFAGFIEANRSVGLCLVESCRHEVDQRFEKILTVFAFAYQFELGAAPGCKRHQLNDRLAVNGLPVAQHLKGCRELGCDFNEAAYGPGMKSCSVWYDDLSDQSTIRSTQFSQRDRFSLKIGRAFDRTMWHVIPFGEERPRRSLESPEYLKTQTLSSFKKPESPRVTRQFLLLNS